MKTLFLDLKVFIFLLILSFFILLFDNLGYLNHPKGMLQNLTVPIQYGLYKTSSNVVGQLSFLTFSRKDYLENKALKVQLAQVLSENADLQERLKEQEELTDQYDKLSPQTFDLLPARLIGAERYITVDKGSADGVLVNQVVVYKDNYLGKIKNVSPKSSQIILATDPESKIAVFSQSADGRARGILQGQFGSELLMDKILHEETINVGDLVYSEGTEGNLPKGLVVGKVIKVMERQNEIFKQALIEPIFKIVNLDLVFIIR